MMETQKPNRFQDLIQTSEVPVFVDFWADWCGPCKMMDPLIKELPKIYGKRLKVVKINVDLQPAVANQYQIQSIPTMMMFWKGQTIMKVAGALPLPQLKQQIEAHYPKELG